MLSNLLGTVAAYCGAFSLFIMLPILWAVIGRHYDKILKDVYNPMNAAYDFPRLGRAVQYSLLVIFGRGMRKSLDRAIFGDYDFRKDARLIDKVVAYLMWIPLSLGLPLALISVVLQFAGM